jgi:hypothetical protein
VKFASEHPFHSIPSELESYDERLALEAEFLKVRTVLFFFFMIIATLRLSILWLRLTLFFRS